MIICLFTFTNDCLMCEQLCSYVRLVVSYSLAGFHFGDGAWCSDTQCMPDWMFQTKYGDNRENIQQIYFRGHTFLLPGKCHGVWMYPGRRS